MPGHYGKKMPAKKKVPQKALRKQQKKMAKKK
jgi:hypothetical protein